jgi:hypothetical protein
VITLSEQVSNLAWFKLGTIAGTILIICGIYLFFYFKDEYSYTTRRIMLFQYLSLSSSIYAISIGNYYLDSNEFASNISGISAAIFLIIFIILSIIVKIRIKNQN